VTSTILSRFFLIILCDYSENLEHFDSSLPPLATMSTTYQFNITNDTLIDYTYTIKAPNIPSPIPLDPSMVFPPSHTTKIPAVVQKSILQTSLVIVNVNLPLLPLSPLLSPLSSNTFWYSHSTLNFFTLLFFLTDESNRSTSLPYHRHCLSPY
jgi:hypothetical protein